MIANKKSVLVLATADYDDTPYDQWLASDEFDVHVITTEEKLAQYSHMANVTMFPNYWDNGSVDLMAYRLGKQLDVCAIIARGEGDLLRAAKIRELLGVPGQNWESALAFRSKLDMKRRLHKAGIEVPTFMPVQTAADVVEFVEAFGYPLVLKPVSGSGSLGTEIIFDEQRLDTVLSRGFVYAMEIESFIEGDMYHVDGLIANGRVALVCPSKYVNTCLSFRDHAFLGSYALSESNSLYRRLVDLTQRVLHKLPLYEHMTFHAEFFHTPADRLVFCEITSRTGGGRVCRTLKHLYGIDIEEQWFRAQVGLPVSLPSLRPEHPQEVMGWLMIYPNDGQLTNLPSGSPPTSVVDYKLRGCIGDQFTSARKSGEYLAAFVVTGSLEKDMVTRFSEIADWFRDGSSWTSCDNEIQRQGVA